MLVSFEQLQEVTGIRQVSAMENHLRKQGIPFLYGKNGLFTTTDAINAAMGISGATIDQKKQPEIDIL